MRSLTVDYEVTAVLLVFFFVMMYIIIGSVVVNTVVNYGETVPQARARIYCYSPTLAILFSVATFGVVSYVEFLMWFQEFVDELNN